MFVSGGGMNNRGSTCKFRKAQYEIYTWTLCDSYLHENHTCEPSDGRINSPVFLGHLPISNILPNSPDFYMFLPYSPDFYMFRSQMCNLHHVHLGQGSKMQFEWHIIVFWILYTVQKSFILTPNFVLTTLYTHPGLIISHLVDDYLNIC